MIVGDPLDRLERALGVDDPSLDVEQIHVARYPNAADHARDFRFDGGGLYQRRGIFDVLCDHRLSQLKQFHGIFALLKRGFLQFLSQDLSEEFQALRTGRSWTVSCFWRKLWAIVP